MHVTPFETNDVVRLTTLREIFLDLITSFMASMFSVARTQPHLYVSDCTCSYRTNMDDSSFSRHFLRIWLELLQVVIIRVALQTSEYVVEQLEIIINTVSTLKSYLGSHLPSSELESEIAISNV